MSASVRPGVVLQEEAAENKMTRRVRRSTLDGPGHRTWSTAPSGLFIKLGEWKVITVRLFHLVNTFIIQFFRGKDVDKCLLQSAKWASDKEMSALPII
jgi:hypothetical protein